MDTLDYVILSNSPPPAEYPFDASPDTYSMEPSSPHYIVRKESFIDFVLKNPAPTNTKAPYFELVRLYAGGSPHEGILFATLDYIDSRKDCSDFALHAILRLLYQFGDHPGISDSLKSRACETVLNFKYWPDEPGQDSMCTWTENHYILFASSALLAGQLFPKQTFTNSGLTGEEMIRKHYQRVQQWLNLRYYTGFSEWLSHVYYDEDLTALLSLTDFCHYDEIRQKAKIMIDLLLVDMALNSFGGIFGCTHGRSYEDTKKWISHESTLATAKLLFGRGLYSTEDNMSACAFTLSNHYDMPQVLFEIANDNHTPEIVNRQRMGIRLDKAHWWGLKPNNFENGMSLLTLESYMHPRTANLFVDMLNAYNWWENRFFAPFKSKRLLIKLLRSLQVLPILMRVFEKDVGRNTREEVNIYTYRTPDYMLSSAQDYRKGFGGDQQHIWQATLGPNAVCFTTHPARLQGDTPNYWSGSGSLPRVAQIKNVVIAIYRISQRPALYVRNELTYTHAWLPKDKFEEIYEQDGWVFARYGNAYLALRSQRPYDWRTLPGEDQNREIIAHGKHNIWVCELGRKETDGEFHQFRESILQSFIKFHRSSITYQSPSQGLIRFGWRGKLKHEGRMIALDRYPRFGNPYVQCDFPSETVEIQFGNHSLNLDWPEKSRRSSGYI